MNPRQHKAQVAALIDARDVPALARRENIPRAVRALTLYPQCWAHLLEGGLCLPLRVMRGLTLGSSEATFTLAKTVRTLRAAPALKAAIVWGLLTGEGGDPRAVLLRRLAEHVRGAPLPVYDLSEAATIESDEFLIRSEAQQRAASVRTPKPEEPKAAKPKAPPRMHITPPAQRKANRIERERKAADLKDQREAQRAQRLEYSRAYAKRRKAERADRQICLSDPADELSERLSFRERQARGES